MVQNTCIIGNSSSLTKAECNSSIKERKGANSVTNFLKQNLKIRLKESAY